MRVDNADDFMSFYRATTYYVPDAEPEVRKRVGDTLRKVGHFEYEKNGYLILGSQRLAGK
jgi:hypothetical protein